MKTAVVLTSLLAALAISAQALPISIASLTATGATNANGSNVTFTATITEDSLTNGSATVRLYINATNGLTGYCIGPDSITFDPVPLGVDGSGICYFTNTYWNPYFIGDFSVMAVATLTNELYAADFVSATITITVARAIGGTLNSMQVPVDTNAAYDANGVFTNICVTQAYIFNGGIDVWLNDSGVESAIWIGCNLVNANPIWWPSQTYEEGQIAFLDTGVYRPAGTPFRFDMNLHKRPTTMLVFGDIKRFLWTPDSAATPNGSGKLVLDLTSSSPWRNDFSTNFQASVGFTPLFATDTNVTEEMENMILCTSAFYSDVMPVINTNGIGVKVNGRTNATSYLKAFVPDTLLAKWGVPVDQATELLAGFTTHFNASGESEGDTTETTLAFNRITGGTNIIYAWNSSTNGDSGYEARFTFTFHSPVAAQIGMATNVTLPSVEGDFDGDKYADPYWPIKSHVLGIWTVWMSSAGYAKQGPFDFSVADGEPIRAADFDGDGYADPVMVANGNWYVWMTSAGYARQGPFAFSVAGISSADYLAADFDGDRYADPALEDEAGNWYIWMTSAGYARQGPFTFAVAGGEPIAADFDGDRYADPAMVINGAWTIWFTSLGYAQQGPFTFSVAGADPMPMAGDFDGDRYADPAMVVDHNWTVWMSSAQYAPQGPFPFVP